MPNSRSFDHLFNGRFMVEISGVNVASFTACDGLEASVDVVRFADGSDKLGRERKRPGRTRYANIVLRRGLTLDDELWRWFKAVADGGIERRSGAIIVNGDDGSEKLRYNFHEAWPCRWKSLELRTDEPGTLVEELELAVELVERA